MKKIVAILVAVLMIATAAQAKVTNKWEVNSIILEDGKRLVGNLYEMVQGFGIDDDDELDEPTSYSIFTYRISIGDTTIYEGPAEIFIDDSLSLYDMTPIHLKPQVDAYAKLMQSNAKRNHHTDDIRILREKSALEFKKTSKSFHFLFPSNLSYKELQEIHGYGGIVKTEIASTSVGDFVVFDVNYPKDLGNWFILKLEQPIEGFRNMTKNDLLNKINNGGYGIWTILN